MASLESTHGKSLKREFTLVIAGAGDYAFWINKGFDQVYDDVTKGDMSKDDAAAEERKHECDGALWTSLWSAVITKWKDRHGRMNGNEIDLMSTLFRQWLEKYWIENDCHDKLREIAKASMDLEGQFVDLKQAEKKQKCFENDTPVWDNEKKIFHESVEAIDGKTYILEYTDPVEKQKQIEEVKAVLRTGSMAGAILFCFQK
jgi:hypothetical protein